MRSGSGVRKILIVRNDNLGDVLCTTPAIEALKRGVPGAWIGVLVAEYAEPALEGNPFVDRVYRYAKAKHGAGKLRSWIGVARMIAAIRAERFDAALAMRSRLTPVLSGLVRCSGARVRIGFRPSPARPGLGRWMTHLVDPPKASLHEVERCMRLARVLAPDAAAGAMRLYLDDGEKHAAQRELEQRGIAPAVRPVCIHVSSRRKAGRYWPTAHYIKLIRGLGKAGIPVVLNCVPHERETGMEIARGLPERIMEIEVDGIRALGALFAVCGGVVALHGGGAHLAASVGTPTIAIFNGGDPESWRPWGEGHRVVAGVPGDKDVDPDRVASAVIARFKR